MTNQMWCLPLNSSNMTSKQQITEMSFTNFAFFATTGIINTALIHTNIKYILYIQSVFIFGNTHVRSLH